MRSVRHNNRSVIYNSTLEQDIKPYYYKVKPAEQKYLFIDSKDTFSFDKLNKTDDSEYKRHKYRNDTKPVCDIILDDVNPKQSGDKPVYMRKTDKSPFRAYRRDIDRTD